MAAKSSALKKKIVGKGLADAIFKQSMKRADEQFTKDNLSKWQRALKGDPVAKRFVKANEEHY